MFVGVFIRRSIHLLLITSRVKPGLQLVLWKPPGDGVLEEIKKKLNDTNKENDQETPDPKETLQSKESDSFLAYDEMMGFVDAILFC